MTEQHLPSGDKLVAIGCGFGGPFNINKGQVITSVHIHGWQGFYLKDWFENTFSLPAFVDNDSNVAAWGEYCLGIGKGCQHFFYTNIGSGVGGGLIFDGKLFVGQGFGAGEFGHMYMSLIGGILSLETRQ
jgi:glucokinase